MTHDAQAKESLSSSRISATSPTENLQFDVIEFVDRGSVLAGRRMSANRVKGEEKLLAQCSRVRVQSGASHVACLGARAFDDDDVARVMSTKAEGQSSWIAIRRILVATKAQGPRFHVRGACVTESMSVLTDPATCGVLVSELTNCCSTRRVGSSMTMTMAMTHSGKVNQHYLAAWPYRHE